MWNKAKQMGCTEQRLRALRERLHISVEEVRRTGVVVLLDHRVAQWDSATCRVDFRNYP